MKAIHKLDEMGIARCRLEIAAVGPDLLQQPPDQLAPRVDVSAAFGELGR
jgi:hypothetical protein